ncbi:MAG: hypothetical protein IJQ93_10450 [Bacteroidales bacterium]|nr:hypothetical protein [Bacteroidales bacterium]
MIEKDLLSSLEPFFAEGVDVGDLDKVNKLHDIFERDFFTEGVVIDGEHLIVKPYKYAGSDKDQLPREYENYYEKFVHIITRTVKASSRKTASSIREFCPKRANRIHWIRPILENADDKRITRFQYMEDDGTIRDYFWYRGKQYIVIVEHIAPDYALITGFCVDADNQPYYQKKYINREK